MATRIGPPPSFGDHASSLAVQPDGEIVAVESEIGFQPVIVRFDASGGTVAAGIDASGATPEALLASFNSDGTRDGVAYAPSGMSAIRAVAVQPQESGYAIIAAGLSPLPPGEGQGVRAFSMVRYNSDGLLDASFAGGQAVVSPFGSSFRPDRLAVESDGSILVGGYVYGGGWADLAVARYNADGTLDTSFGSGGGAVAGVNAFKDDPCGIAVDAAGNVVLAGTALVVPPGHHVPMVGGSSSDYAFALARFTSAGVLDTNFGSGGTVVDNFDNDANHDNHATAAALELNGDIIVAGYSDSGYLDLVRYNSDGSRDIYFGSGGEVTGTIAAGLVSSAAIEADGKVLVGGAFGSNTYFGLGASTPTARRTTSSAPTAWPSPLSFRERARVRARERPAAARPTPWPLSRTAASLRPAWRAISGAWPMQATRRSWPACSWAA